tara:strand:- start:1482 stop:2393 length:912 start_codon:yes stop_codon:yes gene_type:complete
MKIKEFQKLLKSLPEEGLDDISLDDLNFDTSYVMEFLDKNPKFQSTSSEVYKLFKKLMIAKYALHFHKHETKEKIIGIDINFPSISLGAITSRHFFGIDEVLIYQFYKKNTKRYKKVADIGCNCGLHSKILCELGYLVDSYEPDVTHAKFAKKFLEIYPNNNFNEKAVSNYSGKAIFTKIINNSTGSYINDKKNGYGPLEKYEVEVINGFELSNKYDLIKMDIEGSEADVLSSFDPEIFKKTDIIAEVSTEKTRAILWNFFNRLNIKVYSQKTGWNIVNAIEDLPTSHREGSIFISENNTWTN